MLRLLRVRNVAVVPALDVEFGAGLNLLTGETGAGKSILVDALGLLLGTRASADIIRTGEESARVEAVVSNAAIGSALERHAIPGDAGEETILRREIFVSGKSRATVNGVIVPLAVLKELAPYVASIQGQHESQSLLDSDAQQDFLDGFAGLVPQREEVAVRYRALRELERRLADLRRDRRELERRRETVEYQLHEIDASQLVAGEEQCLRREKTLLANAGRLAELSAGAYALLYEDEQAVLAQLGQVYRRVEELAAIDARFSPYLDGRAAARAQLEDLALFLRDYGQELTFSPGRLDEVEARLAMIDRLKRKYGATVEEILSFAERCRAELEELAAPEVRERALEAECSAAAKRYVEPASELSRRRRKAAEEIARRLRAEMKDLAMEKARFSVRFDPEHVTDDPDRREGWAERGLETAEFLLSPNPGEDMRPLARVASGGELSRIMLALRSILTGDGAPEDRTLVFDEVDAGIGGAVAEVVGRKLWRVARRQQVLCITHLPQIAALADEHFCVSKEVSDGRTVARIERLDRSGRVDEVARMLGGEKVTETARRHARELLDARDTMK
jgi:DNA repair protein RecN (Recombination protein N)